MTGSRSPFLWLLVLTAATTACSPAPPPASASSLAIFTALDDAGKPVDPSAGGWRCARDERTGLMWEIKSEAAGLHDWRNTYSWHDPDQHDGKGGLDYSGTANGGACAGSPCDTFAYPQSVNSVGLCGYNDWRIPSRNELASISEPSRAESPPTIVVDYFPHAQSAEYWTQNDYQFRHDAAWLWNFRFGHDRVEWKKSPRYVRLVRGNAVGLTPVKE